MPTDTERLDWLVARGHYLDDWMECWAVIRVEGEALMAKGSTPRAAIDNAMAAEREPDDA